MSKRLPTRSKKRATRSPRANRSAARRARGGPRGRTSETQAAADTALRLPAECTLAEVHELKSKLAALLKAEHAVCLDVSSVRRIDTASLQLLAAFARDRRASRLAVDLQGESAAFEEAVRLLGLRRLFDRDLVSNPA